MLDANNILKNIHQITQTLPANIFLEAAAKTRSLEEVQTAISAGIWALGYNYVQEAEQFKKQINAPVRWHLIGHLQKNKVKKAVNIFDMIETLDSVELAEQLDFECAKINKTMDVLIEVNSGEEARKTGVSPDQVESLIRRVCTLKNIRIRGLMTMGPWVENSEHMRPFFRRTREIFDHVAALKIPNVDMRYLSMGMSDSYKIAIEEGANIIRLGTILFGPRSQRR